VDPRSTTGSWVSGCVVLSVYAATADEKNSSIVNIFTTRPTEVRYIFRESVSQTVPVSQKIELMLNEKSLSKAESASPNP
jgi:uncharacterized phage-associated protein